MAQESCEVGSELYYYSITLLCRLCLDLFSGMERFFLVRLHIQGLHYDYRFFFLIDKCSKIREPMNFMMHLHLLLLKLLD